MRDIERDVIGHMVTGTTRKKGKLKREEGRRKSEREEREREGIGRRNID